MRRLLRFLKLAECLSKNNDINGLNVLCTQFNSFIKKHGHFVPDNDGKTPNPWRRNMDYAEWENSPYFGSVSEFMEKFPGGIKDWVEWRRKTQEDRNKKWDIKASLKKTSSKELDNMYLDRIVPRVSAIGGYANLSEEQTELYDDFENMHTEISVMEDELESMRRDKIKPMEDELRSIGEKLLKSLEEPIGRKANKIDYFGEEEPEEEESEAKEKALELIEKNIEIYKEMADLSDEDIIKWLESKYGKMAKASLTIEAKKDLREELSDLEHKQWMEWAKVIMKQEDISDDRKKRWKEYMVPYEKLSDETKDFDREWADKVIKIMKKHKKLESKAHYEPVGPDNTKKFPKEPHLWSGDGVSSFKSILDFIKKHRSQDTNDAVDKAVVDFINYWKLLKKTKGQKKNR